jgi:ABC-type sugar transport system substrate-binding protein
MRKTLLLSPYLATVARVFKEDARGMSKLLTVVSLGVLLTFGLPQGVSAEEKYRAVIIPKLIGIDYYTAAKRGVDEAAKELPEMKVIWTGPSQDLVQIQIEIIEKQITERPDLIAVAANDPVAIVPVLKKAKAAGIHVMSWDGDAKFREFFVNLVDFKEFGTQLVEALQEQTGPKGDIAIITTSFAAPNQMSWIKAIKKHIYAKYPDLQIVDIRPAGENTEEAYRITQDYLRTYPNLKGIIALGAPNPAGVAKAVKEAGLAGKVAVTGNSTPNLIRPYIHDGTVRKALLWNAPDHGYLTVWSSYRLLRDELKPGIEFKAGRLGTFVPKGDAQNMQVALPVLIFTKQNINEYDF